MLWVQYLDFLHRSWSDVLICLLIYLSLVALFHRCCSLQMNHTFHKECSISTIGLVTFPCNLFFYAHDRVSCTSVAGCCIALDQNLFSLQDVVWFIHVFQLELHGVVILEWYVQGKDYQTQLQLGNNAFYGFNYIQVQCAEFAFSLWLLFACNLCRCHLGLMPWRGTHLSDMLSSWWWLRNFC